MPRKNVPKKLFISHAENATPLASFLHENIKFILPNIETWCSTDPECLKQGMDSSNNIISASRVECFACLALLTKQSVDKWWVNFETGCFHGMKKPVFGLLAGDGVSYEKLASKGHPLSCLGMYYTRWDQGSLTNLFISINNALPKSYQIKSDVIKVSVEAHFIRLNDRFMQLYSGRAATIDNMISKLTDD